MPEPTLADVMNAVAALTTEVGKLSTDVGRLSTDVGRLSTDVANLGREQTRLRGDVAAQTERVLTALAEVRDDVTVSMHFASRADRASDDTGPMLRALQSQLTRLKDRLDRLEGRSGM